MKRSPATGRIQPETLDLFDAVCRREIEGKNSYQLSNELWMALALKPWEITPILRRVDPPQWIRREPQLMERWLSAREVQKQRAKREAKGMMRKDLSEEIGGLFNQ